MTGFGNKKLKNLKAKHVNKMIKKHIFKINLNTRTPVNGQITINVEWAFKSIQMVTLTTVNSTTMFSTATVSFSTKKIPLTTQVHLLILRNMVRSS